MRVRSLPTVFIHYPHVKQISYFLSSSSISIPYRPHEEGAREVGGAGQLQKWAGDSERAQDVVSRARRIYYVFITLGGARGRKYTSGVSHALSVNIRNSITA